MQRIRYGMAVGVAFAMSALVASAGDGPGRNPLEAFDANDDGAISSAELVTGATAWVEDRLAVFLEKYDSIPAGSVSGDGVITAAEIQAAGAAHGAEWLADVLERFDSNDDGQITADDKVPARSRSYRGLLSDLDANDDGSVSNEELATGASERTTAYVERFIRRYDSVPDGATAGDGIVTAAEVTLLFQDQIAEQVERVLDRVDADGDGALSVEELLEGSPRRGSGHGGGSGFSRGR